MAVAFIVLVSGCIGRSMGDSWSLHVFAGEGTEVPPSEMLCQGSIKASVQFNSGQSLSAFATPDKPYDHARLKHDGAISPGQAVTIEAVCNDEFGNEVGYSKVKGRVTRPEGFKRNASTSVWPWSEGLSSGDLCLYAAVTRGLPPCVTDYGGNVQPL